MMPWANIWKTDPLRPASVSVAAPSMTTPMWRHRRVRDDVLQVLLRHRAERAVDDVDARRSSPTSQRPVERRLRQQPHAQAHDAVGAELHQHARVQHRHGGRRRRVAVGRPRVERPDAGEDAEADVERQEHPRLQLSGRTCTASQDQERERRATRRRRTAPGSPTRMNADPNSRYSVSFIAAYSFVPTPVRPNAQPKMPCGRTSPGRAPDADEQVHRQHGDLVEQEEDEEVERHEHAEDAGDEQEQQGVELLAARLDRPGRERRRRR